MKVMLAKRYGERAFVRVLYIFVPCDGEIVAK
jgi:hypothetical protein